MNKIDTEMTYQQMLRTLRADSATMREMGTKFELVCREWLKAEPTYSNIERVWMWNEFPSRMDFGSGGDMGIDLVARTNAGEYWAIQCKFYDTDTRISKGDIDSFLANARHVFTDPITGDTGTKFSSLMCISTTENWNPNALAAVEMLDVEFSLVGPSTLRQSKVDWNAIYYGSPIPTVKKRHPLPHQKEAISRALAHFADHDRGRLIMACGTGKTYTSLKIVEDSANDECAVLFLVPSISLLNQTLNAYMSDATVSILPICVCSDSKASHARAKLMDEFYDLPIFLKHPASTNPDAAASRFIRYRKCQQESSTGSNNANVKKVIIVFSTYQSIGIVKDMQDIVAEKLGKDSATFDYAICDEAHRTTGIKFAGESDEDASNFVKIHDGDYIKTKRRLYMTATPRLYSPNAKVKAKKNDAELYSMDDESKYGGEIYRLGFGYAVDHGLLTDYKVLVLTVNEKSPEAKRILRLMHADDVASDSSDGSSATSDAVNSDAVNKGPKFEKLPDVVEYQLKMYGTVMALSKQVLEKGSITWNADPCLMRRAIVFCPNIDKNGDPASSKNTSAMLPRISEEISRNATEILGNTPHPGPPPQVGREISRDVSSVFDDQRASSESGLAKTDSNPIATNQGSTSQANAFSATREPTGTVNSFAANQGGDPSQTSPSPDDGNSSSAGDPSQTSPSPLAGDPSQTSPSPLAGEGQGWGVTLAHATSHEMAHIKARHIDGSMDSSIRADALEWLAAEADDPSECRVLCNVRCLSEGVDVPALDAVIFVSPRASQIDIVQSVGRIMRNFTRPNGEKKRYGYIIIPIVVSPNLLPEVAMENNRDYKTIWQILSALRSHDERFNAIINKIDLNIGTPERIRVLEPGFTPPESDGTEMVSDTDAARDFIMRTQGSLIEGYGTVIYAKMVTKVGDREYWEHCAEKVGTAAKEFIARIGDMISKPGEHQLAFKEFVKGLQININPSVTESQALEMLGQHFVSKPVFDALFGNDEFTASNPVSRSMEDMIATLHSAGLENYTTTTNEVYENLRMHFDGVESPEARQRIIKTLYERFFRAAFPKTVEQLGIVYTPVECVDFILHSVDSLLRSEFGRGITDEGVHVLDPFTGTGTFMTRLLQSRLIEPKDLPRKYKEELHANEIVLLAYYVAGINIESVFHDVSENKEYQRFNGICLTDTFELAESDQPVLCQTFKDNSESIELQRNTPIQVIIGNPPYSIGQKSGNDNAQNLEYPVLDKRIAETYAENSTAALKNSLYDSYIRAFRWSSDRVSKNPDGGIIGFITNGGWLKSNSGDGFRKCLEEEFSSIYVFDLRGDQRTSGELSRKEGGKIFGSGSRAPITLTFLVKKPGYRGKAKILYSDIGDYLSREEKLKILRDRRSIESQEMNWQEITPNEHADWLAQRSELFKEYILIGDKHNKDLKETFFTPNYSSGVKTDRDAWCWNFSKKHLEEKITSAIDFYNEQCEVVASGGEIDMNPTKFSWTDNTRTSVKKNEKFDILDGTFLTGIYRPFCKQNLYFSDCLIERLGKNIDIFPTKNHENLVISVHGAGTKKDFSCIITNIIPDYSIVAASQCFPLYTYKKIEVSGNDEQRNLGELYTPHPTPPPQGGREISRDVSSAFDDQRASSESGLAKTDSNPFAASQGSTSQANAFSANQEPASTVNSFAASQGSASQANAFSANQEPASTVNSFAASQGSAIPSGVLPPSPLAGDSSQTFSFPFAGDPSQTSPSPLAGEGWGGGSKDNPLRGYTRQDGITDWILQTVKDTYEITDNAITKEDIFYYVYGILHSTDYRMRFNDDLKKSLPRIPLVGDDINVFLAFSEAGRRLADLHLNYEKIPPCPDVEVQLDGMPIDSHNLPADLLRLDKMRPKSKEDKSTIFYNEHVSISSIPAKAYDYIVNGKSAIEWIMERYAIKTDKDSGIVNDPNEWMAEHNNPRYALDLLLSVINVSVQTVDIVNSLPRIDFPQDDDVHG